MSYNNRFYNGLIGNSLVRPEGTSGVRGIRNPHILSPVGELWWSGIFGGNYDFYPDSDWLSGGVWNVSIVAIGGGGGGSGSTSSSNGTSGGGGNGGNLHYINNLSLDGSHQYRMRVGTGGYGGLLQQQGGDGGNTYLYDLTTSSHVIYAYGGRRGRYASTSANDINSPQSQVMSAFGFGGTGYSGGVGGRGSSGNAGGGGGGTAGYSGIGGNGGYYSGGAVNATAGSGGGGSGAKAINSLNANLSYGGGGTMPFGEGTSGAAPGSGTNAYGNPGSRDTQTTITFANGSTGNMSSQLANIFGGGGSGSEDDSAGRGAPGDQGAIRIIWGKDRAFPSTNVTQDMSEGNITYTGS